MSQLKTEFRPPRRLRVFAFDPSTGRQFANRDARIVTISLPYELDADADVGPRGEYLEVIDVDPASDAYYVPLDLNSDQVRFNDGLEPSPENPQFHQQMVYAVAMNTVAVFEEALGRVVQWAPKISQDDQGNWVDTYIQRLRIFPHALREANAFYNPKKKALLFGYFDAPETSTGAPAGTTVFTCLSHDVIVHETVHAILDGMHPHFAENANPDIRGLHEAFADIVALFQMFSYPEVLMDQIAKTRGNLSRQNILGELAQEFGKALGRGHALRNFLGSENPETGDWEPLTPDPQKFYNAKGPHDRGSVLVAAVFRAFLTIYKARVADLFRIASNGSGKLREGEIDPDLKRRLSAEAAQCARRVMRICIRAMDYTPPVNVTFGDYLRAILTADHDLFPEDKQGYRDAFLEAFSAWGILPRDVNVPSVGALLWPTLSQAEQDRLASGHASGEGTVDVSKVRAHLGMLMENPNLMLQEMKFGDRQFKADELPRRIKLIEKAENDLKEASLLIRRELGHLEAERHDTKASATRFSKTEVLSSNMLEIGSTKDRHIEYLISNYYKQLLWFLLTNEQTSRFAQLIGINFDPEAPPTVRRSFNTGCPSLHVHSVRIAKRVGQRGALDREYIVELIQTRRGYYDPDQQEYEDQMELREENEDRAFDFKYRAGTTFLVDASTYNIRRLIRSSYPVHCNTGLALQRAHLLGDAARQNNAFFDGSTSDSDTAFTDLHRFETAQDSFG